jgi:hypothetical protein
LQDWFARAIDALNEVSRAVVAARRGAPFTGRVMGIIDALRKIIENEARRPPPRDD